MCGLLPCMQGLPLEHLLPCLLIVGVMNLDDVRHILGLQRVLLPPPTYNTHTHTHTHTDTLWLHGGEGGKTKAVFTATVRHRTCDNLAPTDTKGVGGAGRPFTKAIHYPPLLLPAVGINRNHFQHVLRSWILIYNNPTLHEELSLTGVPTYCDEK